MKPTYKLTEAAFDDLSSAAKQQAEDMIDSLLRPVVDDFETSDSDSFKLTLAIEGTRDGAKVYLQTKAQSSVDLKRKDQTKLATINPEPGFFDKDGEPTHPVKPAPVQVNVHLIAAPPKQLPAPAEMKEAEVIEVSDVETLPAVGTVKAEPVGKVLVPSPDGAVKLKTVTISNTGVSPDSLRDHPEWYSELSTTRKFGLVSLGEVVQLFMKNPDFHKRFPLGLYRCTDLVPASEDPCESRSTYTFTKLENNGEAGPDAPAEK